MKRRLPLSKMANHVAEEPQYMSEPVTIKQEAYIECVKEEYKLPEEEPDPNKTIAAQEGSNANSKPVGPTATIFGNVQLSETMAASDVKAEIPDDEYQRICRGCLNTDENNLVSIFEDGVAKMFESFCGINIDKADQISSMICNDCRYKVLDLHFFRDVCITNTNMLWYRYQSQHGLLDCSPVENTCIDTLAHTFGVNNLANNNVPVEDSETDDELLLPLIPKHPIKKKKLQVKQTKKQSSIDITSKTYTCNVCHKQYNSKKSWKKHIKIHEGHDPSTFTIECSVCKVLRRKQDKHKCVDRKIKCYLCETSFPNWMYLKMHLKKTHNVVGSKKEIEAKKVVKYLTALTPSKMRLKPSNVFPLTIPGDDALFACCHCGESYKSLTFLEMHRKMHAQAQRTQCNVCLFNFRSYRVLETHFDQHEDFYEPERGDRSCPECLKQFCRRQTVLLHLKIVHENRHVVKCSKCFYLFTNQDALVGHNCELNPLMVIQPVKPVKTAKEKDWELESAQETEYDTDESESERESDVSSNTNQGSDFVIVPAESILPVMDGTNNVPEQPQSSENASLLNVNDNLIYISDEESVDKYDCTDCNLVFLKQDTLHRHMKLHNKKF